MNPWPGAFFEWKGAPLKVHQARVSGEQSPGAGSRITVQGWPAVGTSEGILILEEVQPAGKKAMPGKAFLAGAREWAS
jgi:methionyl-tRNA formyltransferase